MTGIWLVAFLIWFTLYFVIGFLRGMEGIIKIGEKLNIVLDFVEEKLDWVVKFPKYVGKFVAYILQKINDLINFIKK